MLTQWHWIGEQQTGRAPLRLRASARRSAAADEPNVHLHARLSFDFQLKSVCPTCRETSHLDVVWVSCDWKPSQRYLNDARKLQMMDTPHLQMQKYWL